MPCEEGPRRCRKGKLLQRAGSMGTSQSGISGLRVGLHTVRGGTYPGDHRFRPRVVVIVNARRYL